MMFFILLLWRCVIHGSALKWIEETLIEGSKILPRIALYVWFSQQRLTYHGHANSRERSEPQHGLV
jgi:hypothetical protein